LENFILIRVQNRVKENVGKKFNAQAYQAAGVGIAAEVGFAPAGSTQSVFESLR
jgi:hypothetical protein